MKKPVFEPISVPHERPKTSSGISYSYPHIRIFKRYKITPHIQEGFILEHRKLFGRWKQLLIFNTKNEALNGAERHKKIRSEYY